MLRSFGGVFLFLRAADAAFIAAALWGATVLLDHEWRGLNYSAVIVAVTIFLIGGELRRLYSSWRLTSMNEEFRSILIIWGTTCCALIIGFFFTKVSSGYSRLEMLVWFLITPAFLIGSRLAMRGALRLLRKSGHNIRTVAVAGATDVAKSLIRMLEESSTFGVRMLGVFDRDQNGMQSAPDTLREGSFEDLVSKAKRGGVDYIFITLPMRDEERIVDLVQQLADTTASVYVVPDLFVFDLMRARWATIGNLPAVSVYESPFDGLSGLVKRAEDLIVGSLLLVITAIPMLMVAIGLKLTKAETIFFRQQRYGLNGRVVRVWKFRTMTVSEDGADVVQAKQKDLRITPFGRFLRATSLDELPQLLNVLSGEMSLVGPRPHAIKVNEEYRRLVHGYMLRHKIKPGITGWAQVNGWHGDDTVEKMQKRVEHDLAYLQDWSLWLDLKILYMTVATVLSRKKAPGAG